MGNAFTAVPSGDITPCLLLDAGYLKYIFYDDQRPSSNFHFSLILMNYQTQIAASAAYFQTFRQENRMIFENLSKLLTFRLMEIFYVDAIESKFL